MLLQFLQNITHSAKISHLWQKLHIFSQKTTKYFHKKLYVRSTFCFHFLCQANIPEPSAQGWGRAGGRLTSSLTDSRRHTRRSRPCAWHSPPPACRLRPGLSGSGVNYRNMTLKLAKAILKKPLIVWTVNTVNCCLVTAMSTQLPVYCKLPQKTVYCKLTQQTVDWQQQYQHNQPLIGNSNINSESLTLTAISTQ